MEHYYSSIKGACLINQLDLPDIALNLIRYYSNLSVDLVGYTKRELIRFITDDPDAISKIYLNKNRSQVIRLLYTFGIHIHPRKHKLNRFKEACNYFISRYEMDHENITIYNNDHNVITKIHTYSIFAVDVVSMKDYCIHQYQAHICRIFSKKEKVKLSCIRCHLKYFQTREVSLAYNITMNIWNFLFIYLHQNHYFINLFYSKSLSTKDYIRCLNDHNITKERSINGNLINDSRKSGLEYISNKIIYKFPSTYNNVFYEN